MGNNDNSPDISGMIERIMQNPEFAGMVKELRGDSGKTDEAVQDDIMSKLPEVMAMLSPMLGDREKQSGGKAKEEKNERGSREHTGGEKFLKNIDKYDKAKATRLMSALKPYLSKERCSMIDKCMSVMQLGDVMTVLRGLDGFGNSDG